MPDYEVEDLKPFFETAVHFLGREWLIRQKREHYGDDQQNHYHDGGPPQVVSEFKRGLEELGYEEPDAPELLSPEKISEPAIRIINLGRFIHELDDAETFYSNSGVVETGLPESTRNRLRNDDEYQKVVFELQIAAGYAREGHQIQLIEEGDKPESDIRIPLDVEVFIECKRVDSLPGNAQTRAGVFESLFKSAQTRINREGVFIFDLDELPTVSQAGRIAEHLPRFTNSRQELHVDLPFGELHVYPFTEPGSIKTVPRGPQSGMLEWKQFADLRVEPILQNRLGISQEDLDKATMESEIRPDGQYLQFKSPSFLGAYIDVDDDHIQPVLNQFQSSLDKFDRDDVNILHVDIPNMFNKFTTSDVDELKRRVGGLLAQNEKVTAFSFSTEHFDRNPAGKMNFGHAMAHMLNRNRAVDLPENFELLGAPVEEFQEQIEDQNES